MERRDVSQSRGGTAEQPTVDAEGWYLFGITRRGSQSTGEAEDGGAGPAQVLELGELAAIVRPVQLSEFAAETLTERAGDAAWLETMVRDHNDVITAVHQRQAILPAKFGSVYADTSDLGEALEQMEDALLAQLDLLEGADEWAVHVYADRQVVETRVAAEDPGIQELQREIANARPGRAYFLQRKLADELGAATDAALDSLAQAAYEQLATYARASQVGPLARSQRSAAGRTEILKAAFLVARADAETFKRAVSSLAPSQDGVDTEYTGPWPPYSFAGPAVDESP